MQLLFLLEKIRNPVFDFVFSLITHIGEETVFLAVAIIFFWCINKRKGYYILITGLVGTVINQFLKLLFRIPRPWVSHPEFTIVESARAEATGYSFPSGHTQNVAGTFGAIGLSYKKLFVRIASIAVIALVAFSRMYLGVHTPWDVLTSLAIAAALIFGLYPFFSNEERFKKAMPFIVAISFVLAAAFLAYVLYMPNKPTYSSDNYQSALKNAYTLFGCTLGLIVVYAFDSLYINFDTKASWYVQVIKLVVGFAGVFGLKAGLSSPLTALFGNEFVARSFRYFLVVVFAGILWPLAFKYLVKIKIKCLDSLGVKVCCVFSPSYKEKVKEEERRLKKLNTPHGKKKKKRK